MTATRSTAARASTARLTARASAARVTARASAVRLAGQVARRWRRRLTTQAVNATSALTGRSLLVLAPHPDDETFGCGALIARARAAGDTVTVVIATDGSRCAESASLRPADIAALRRVELREACAHLGVDDEHTTTLGYADGTLASRLPQLTADIAGLVERLRPDVVLTTCAQDQHPDHRALHDATVAAVASSTAAPTSVASSKAVAPGSDVPLVLGYPVWTWYSAPFFLEAPAKARARLWWWAIRQTVASRTAPAPGRQPDEWWRVPTGPHLSAKRRAVAAYVSQTTAFTGEPGWSFLPPRFVALFEGPDELFHLEQLPAATEALAPPRAPGRRRRRTLRTLW
jgi:LmbE family N-acetylglucosaminyl deacetylase